jgi:hypothetical protein
MLEVKPQHRPKAKKILTHAWLEPEIERVRVLKLEEAAKAAAAPRRGSNRSSTRSTRSGTPYTPYADLLSCFSAFVRCVGLTTSQPGLRHPADRIALAPLVVTSPLPAAGTSSGRVQQRAHRGRHRQHRGRHEHCHLARRLPGGCHLLTPRARSTII